MAINRTIMPCRYICPCKGCQERTQTCHGSCQRYNEYRIKEKKYRKQKRIEERFGEYKPW